MELIDAARRGDIHRVRELLDRGADPYIRAVDGLTPLMHASLRDHVDVVQILLDRGVNPDIPVIDRWTALMYASGQDNMDVMRIVIAYGSSEDMQDDTHYKNMFEQLNMRMKNTINICPRSLYMVRDRSRKYMSDTLSDIDIISMSPVVEYNIRCVISLYMKWN